MVKSEKERVREIKNFCTDMGVLWRKYAKDMSFFSFIHGFESYLTKSVSRGALFGITDLGYIEALRVYCENELRG